MSRTIFTIGILFALSERSFAVPIVFAIDSSKTTLTFAATSSYVDAIPQSPGSDMTSARGHFSIDVDNPTAPSSIAFLKNSGGYNMFLDTGGGANFLPGNSPANGALSALGGVVEIAARDLTWDFISAPTSVNPDGSFAPHAFSVIPRSGSLQASVLGTVVGGDIIPGGTTPVLDGNGRITAANGILNLNVSGYVTQDFNLDGVIVTGTIVGDISATAIYGTSNYTVLDDPSQPVVALGGAGQLGGVTARFGEDTTRGGTFSVQQIPLAGLPYDSIQGLASFGIHSLSQDAQAWEVEYIGGQAVGPITLTFNYDPSKLTASQLTDSSLIYMEHFNLQTGQWENLRGSVDPVLHTITVTTDSLSPFVLSVPENSPAVLLSIGATLGVSILFVRTKRGRLGPTPPGEARP